jgi:hypothetical protein
MADIHIKSKTHYTLCWRCGWSSYEWIRLGKYIQDKGRCFHCRMDALDKRYGPSLQAELSKIKGKYMPVTRLTRWQLRSMRNGYVKA